MSELTKICGISELDELYRYNSAEPGERKR
jgi:hypothetical protein